MGTLRDWLLGPQTPDVQVREAGEVIGGPEEPSPASPAQIAPPRRDAIDRNPMGISMVYRAVSIHAIAVKQMTLVRWHEDVTSAIGVDQRRPLGTFLRRPDINMRRSAFFERCVTDLATTGNFYWLKQLNASGEVANVVLLDPHKMRVVKDPITGTLEYWYGARVKPYQPNEIQHGKLLRVAGIERGLGPIQAARVELDGALDLRDYQSNWFQDSPQPTGVLTSDQVLSDVKAKAAKESWRSSQGGRRDVAVLGQGLTYSPVFLSPRDAQFLESQEFTTTQIARLFGMPASLMLATVQGGSQTYANIEQDWLGFVRFSNMQYLIEIEDALTELLPTFDYTKFNIDAFLRTDTTTRYAGYKSGIDAGWLLPSEVRKEENRPAIVGIDDRPKAQAKTQAADPDAEGTA